MFKRVRLVSGIAMALIAVFSVHIAETQTSSPASALSSTPLSQTPSPLPTPYVSQTPSPSPSISVSPTPTPAPPPAGTAAGVHPYLLFTYVLLIVFFVIALHLVDSVQAYELARRDTKAIWKRLPTPLSADDLAKVQDLLESLTAPSGIAGTTRSILTYSLIIILAIAVFHLLALPPSDKNLANNYADYADKILILIAGSLTTAVGFYFGTKATTEGVAAGKPQQVETPSTPPGRIDKVEPSHAPSGASVVIHGSGFGQDQGNVQFGNVGVATITNWSQTSITVIVPTDARELPPGKKVDVHVNPAHGNKIVGEALFTVDKAAA